MKDLPINYAVADRDSKYYIFDWDNNVLHMPTHIHLERRQPDGSWLPATVTTEEYSRIRRDAENYRPPGGDWERAFREFRDIEDEDVNAFIRDTERAIDRVVRGERRAGPSFRIFRNVLVEGRLFAIVTARGHSPGVLRDGVLYFIRHVLSYDEMERMLANLRGYLECFEPGHGVDLADPQALLAFYLNLNRYHAVTWPEFRRQMGLVADDPQVELGKRMAIEDFVAHVVRIATERGIDKPISFGFSDDDPGNVAAIEQFIRDVLVKKFPGVKFVVYDTSDPDLEAGRKNVVYGQLTLPLR
jgi:hypothetical protein